MSPTPLQTEQPRLNIFALPTRTNILFALIVLVIALPVVASLVGETPLCGPCFVFWIVLLPLWSFLHRPDAQIQRHHMTDLAPAYPQLAAHIDRLITVAGLERKPRVMLSNETGITLRTFGTVTRYYLVIPIARAAQLQVDLESTQTELREGAVAVILHELSHFANRDVAPTFFARSLLVMTIGFMSVSLIFSVLTPFVYNSIIRFFDMASLYSPEVRQLIQAANPDVARAMLNPPAIGPGVWFRYELFVFSAHWPLIVGSLFLLIVFWRALLRTRELYADARVAQWQGTTRILRRELLLEAARESLYTAGRPQKSIVGNVHILFSRLNSLAFLATHPSRTVRDGCLDRPDRLYGSDVAIGLTTGATIVLLNLTLSSLFLSRYLSGPNATLPFVLGFVIIALSLLPSLCASSRSPIDLRRPITRSTLIFTVVKLVPQYIVGIMIALAVVAEPQAIDVAGWTLVGGGGEIVPSLGISPAFIIDVYFIRPAILFTIVMPITLIFLLLIDARLKRLVLTWYGAPIIRDHPILLFWGLTGWLALVLWLVVLPFYNVAAVPTAHSLLDPIVLGAMSVTFGLSLIFSVWLISQHRRYARRCPQCKGFIEGNYQLGRCCPRCGELLQPWLVATH